LAFKLIVDPTQTAALGLAVIVAVGLVKTVTLIAQEVELIVPLLVTSVTSN
jgi:hypothetical protein